MARQVIKAELAGSVFKIEADIGAMVAAGDVLLLLESMKMEVPVEAPIAGKLVELRIAEGEAVAEGQALAVLET